MDHESGVESEVVQPSVHLLSSMRSVGYSLEAAVADLLDNCITAGAHHIAIDADVVDGKYIAVLDDGHGMNSEVAREALRFAGSVGDRDSKDLGRFGLGLKTASLSQARCLTVVTKRSGVVTALRWDVDYVRESGEWRLIVLPDSVRRNLPLWTDFDAQPTGTLVVWSELDLLLGDTLTPGTFLAERLSAVRANIALVFHRFLSDRRHRLTITINGVDVLPTDPFLSDNPKTQRTALETIRIGGADVHVEGFTLPHRSGLTAEERQRPDLGEGMREAQGFYVYRNRRLISHGHWYGLARMSELSKQTRVKVEVPAALDALWQLDVKKSQSNPPTSFKIRLRQLIDPILERGHRVHTFRGRREDSAVAHVWKKLKTREGFRYEVNLENALVGSILDRLNSEDATRIVNLLQMIATTYPFMDAYQEIAGNVAVVGAEPERSVIIARLVDIRDSGYFGEATDVVLSQLIGVEPFNTVKDLSTLVDFVWKGSNDAE